MALVPGLALGACLPQDQSGPDFVGPPPERDFVGPLPGPEPGGTHLDAFDRFMDEIPDDEEWYARHAAMIETESAWAPEAESPYAQGWSQFTPPTRGDWWPKVPGCAELAVSDPFNRRCSVLAMNLYMEWLYQTALRMVQEHEAALRMARKGYNGGMGWQMRERKLCLVTPGCDPDNWRHIEALCREAGRSEASCRENNAYPEKIARAEPKYRERKKRRALRVLGKVAKTAARTAVAVSPSPVGIDDVQRARKAARGIRGRMPGPGRD